MARRCWVSWSRCYTSDAMVHVYEIVQVKRHALDFSIVDVGTPGVEQLVLQTSEGPAGTVPKLQVRAELLDIRPAADPADATPTGEATRLLRRVTSRRPRGRRAYEHREGAGREGPTCLPARVLGGRRSDPVDAPEVDEHAPARSAITNPVTIQNPGCSPKFSANPASLMPKMPATAPMPASTAVTAVSRFMMSDRPLLTVDR